METKDGMLHLTQRELDSPEQRRMLEALAASLLIQRCIMLSPDERRTPLQVAIDYGMVQQDEAESNNSGQEPTSAL